MNKALLTVTAGCLCLLSAAHLTYGQPAPEGDAPEAVHAQCRALEAEVEQTEAQIRDLEHQLERARAAVANYEYARQRNAALLERLNEWVEGP